MSKPMNFSMLREELREMHYEQQVERLKFLGFLGSKIDDLIYNIMNPTQPGPPEKPRISPEFKLSDALQRCEQMIAKVRQDQLNGLVYENPLVRQWTDFEKDVLHIRHLLKTSTKNIYDGATRNNPEFNETQLVRDIDAQYVKGHSKPILLLCGATGCGKTYASIAKVCQIARVEFDFLGRLKYSNAAFVTAKDLTDMLLAKQYSDIKAIREMAVLIIDDLGTEPIGYKGADFNAEFQAIIDYRHKFRKQTILNTNLDPKSEDPNVKTFASQYGDRVLSRIKEVGVVIGSDLTDMRGKSNV